MSGVRILIMGAWVGAVGCESTRATSSSDVDADSDGDSDTGTGTTTNGGQCRPPFFPCGDECVLLESNPRHCGGCDENCSADAPVCLRGECAADCAGKTECSGECVDLATSPLHCGRCGEVCSGGEQRCIDGICTCPEGFERCVGTKWGDGCFDLQSTREACGDCFNECEFPQVCYRGSCEEDCGELTDCSRDCVDLQTARNDCGQCNVICGSWNSCVEGACLPGGDADTDTDADTDSASGE